MSKNKPILSDGVETLEQLTERANKCAKETYPINEVIDTTNIVLTEAYKRAGYIAGVIAEASRNEQARTKDRELIQTLTNSIAFFLNHGPYVDKEMAMFYANGGKSLSAALALAGEQGYQPTEK